MISGAIISGCFTIIVLKKAKYQCSSQKIVLEGQSGPYNPFLGARYFKKGPVYQYLSNMQKRRSSWKVKEGDMERPFLYTIEEIFGNKANSTIRMYAIKIASNFFHLIFHFTVKICFHSLILNCFVSIHFFVTSEKKLLIDLEDAFVRFILFRDAMMDTHELLRYYTSQVEA